MFGCSGVFEISFHLKIVPCLVKRLALLAHPSTLFGLRWIESLSGVIHVRS